MKRERQQIIIIGLGKFGMGVAKTLSKYDCDVMAIDRNENLIADVSPLVTHAAKVDAIDKDALLELGIKNFDVAILGIGDDLEASIMIALTLKELKVPYIVAKSRDDMHTRLLTMIGVDKVVQPEEYVAVRIAKNLMHQNVIERMEFGKDYSIVEIKMPIEWQHKNLKQINVRPSYNINIVSIKKEDGDVIIPTASYELQPSDCLMLIAPNKEIEAGGFLETLEY